ncbi:DUF11 domain-containing protein, partial [Deinococcus ruber]|uniref:DUF11 domain-containing protein n=1 Tax=Deinococcus ruber TaxID=1848197 RepID=UPI001E411C9B
MKLVALLLTLAGYGLFSTAQAATLSLQKALPNGRAAVSDQFTLNLTGATSATTTGTGSSVTSAALSKVGATVGVASTLSETAANGANLSNYTTTYACTNTLGGGQTPSGSGTTFTITPVTNDNLSCTFTNSANLSDLAIDKSGTTSTNVGSPASYTLTVWNIGPKAVTSSTVADTVNSSFLSNVTWTCQAYGTASCGTTSGSGNTISATTGALPVNNVATAPTSGDYLVYTVSGLAATAGTYANTATVTAPSGVVDTSSANNTSTVSGIVVGAAPATASATCAIGSPVNMLATTTKSYYNGTINGFTPKPTGTSVYATGLADIDKQTYSQPVPLIANSANYTVGAGVGSRFTLDLRWLWSNGSPKYSKVILLRNGTTKPPARD